MEAIANLVCSFTNFFGEFPSLEMEQVPVAIAGLLATVPLGHWSLVDGVAVDVFVVDAPGDDRGRSQVPIPSNEVPSAHAEVA
jgi:hypothetical protein